MNLSIYSIHVKQNKRFKNEIHKTERKFMVAPFSNFYGKICVGFCLTTGKRFFHWFFWKTELGIFMIAICLRDWHVFMRQLFKTLNVFNAVTLKQIFWKTKTFFKKLEDCFLVQSTNIEHESFPCKTALFKANVHTKTMGTTKWPCHKIGFLPVILFFWTLCFSLRTSLKESISCTNYSNVHIHTFRKRLSF